MLQIKTGAMPNSVGFSGFSGNSTYTYEKPKSAKTKITKTISVKHFCQQKNNAA